MTKRQAAALEAGGHVEGHPDRDDGRQTLFALTATCRRRLPDGPAARPDWLARILAARLSPQEH